MSAGTAAVLADFAQRLAGYDSHPRTASVSRRTQPVARALVAQPAEHVDGPDADVNRVAVEQLEDRVDREVAEGLEARLQPRHHRAVLVGKRPGQRLGGDGRRGRRPNAVATARRTRRVRVGQGSGERVERGRVADVGLVSRCTRRGRRVTAGAATRRAEQSPPCPGSSSQADRADPLDALSSAQRPMSGVTGPVADPAECGDAARRARGAGSVPASWESAVDRLAVVDAAERLRRGDADRRVLVGQLVEQGVHRRRALACRRAPGPRRRERSSSCPGPVQSGRGRRPRSRCCRARWRWRPGPTYPSGRCAGRGTRRRRRCAACPSARE